MREIKVNDLSARPDGRSTHDGLSTRAALAHSALCRLRLPGGATTTVPADVDRDGLFELHSRGIIEILSYN